MGSGTEVDEIPGLREAVERHEAALLSGDNSKLSSTVVFPHVQFYPDGQVVVLREPSDLRGSTEAPPEWRLSDQTLVRYENDLAIVRASFEGTGGREGADLGAGLWAFLRKEGEWLVCWRHFLGANANQ